MTNFFFKKQTLKSLCKWIRTVLRNSYLGRLEVTYSSNAVIMQNISGTPLSEEFPQWVYQPQEYISLLAFWSHLLFVFNQYYPFWSSALSIIFYSEWSVTKKKKKKTQTHFVTWQRFALFHIHPNILQAFLTEESIKYL